MYNERVLGGSSGCSSTSSVGAVVFDEVGAPYPNFWRLRRWLSPIVIPTAPQGLDHEEETITWICLDSKKKWVNQWDNTKSSSANSRSKYDDINGNING